MEDKVLYLTFDDGPIPDITEYVLEELDHYQAKATFFCVGDNIFKYPAVYRKILEKGHQTGNHTFNHLKGWKTGDEDYLLNIQRCQQEMDLHLDIAQSPSDLFRPPYGLIKRSQIKQIRDQYQIIMWDVLTGDFNKDLSCEKCLHKAIKYTQQGSIIIFHDSIKAERNLKYALPRFLDHFKNKGYRFEVL